MRVTDPPPDPDYPHPPQTLQIPRQPHPPVPAGPNELSRPTLAAGQHLVNDKVETDLAPHVRVVPFRPGDRDGDAVARLGAAPGAPDRRGHAGAIARPPQAHRPRDLPLGHDEEAGDVAGLRVAEVHLQAVRVDVLRLVVESQQRRIAGGRAEAQLRLRHRDGEVQRRVIPAGVGKPREVFGSGDFSGLAYASWDDAALYLDRKSTRLNSSHSHISYAVFC